MCIKGQFGLFNVGHWPQTLNKMKRSFLMIETLILAACLHTTYSQESFQLSFQKSGSLSSEEWAEFTGTIPHLSAFTSCHWEKLDYFNFKYHYVWNYCTIKSISDNIDCIQFSYSRDVLTAGRGVDVLISFGSGNNQHITIPTFHHRTWNHFCWTYDSNFGENKIYLNGMLVGRVLFEIKREALGSSEAFGNSFFIGQEPDAFRGKYDKLQAYRGNISELHFWDHVLKAEDILQIGQCQKRGRGNVISWERKDFKLYNVTAYNVKNISTFCVPEERMLIFPEKYSFPSAVALCKAHGGYLFTPRDQKMNHQFLAEVSPYQSECEDEASGNVAWLGATTKNSEILMKDLTGHLTTGNFTNWRSPPFTKDNKCTYMRNDGKWLAHDSCSGMELCPVCGFLGTPIFTLKGKVSCFFPRLKPPLCRPVF